MKTYLVWGGVKKLGPLEGIWVINVLAENGKDAVKTAKDLWTHGAHLFDVRAIPVDSDKVMKVNTPFVTHWTKAKMAWGLEGDKWVMKELTLKEG